MSRTRTEHLGSRLAFCPTHWVFIHDCRSLSCFLGCFQESCPTPIEWQRASAVCHFWGCEMKHSGWKLSVLDKVSFSPIMFPYPVSSKLLIAFSFFQNFALHLLDVHIKSASSFKRTLTSFKRKSEYTQPGNYLILFLNICSFFFQTSLYEFALSTTSPLL